MTKLSKYKAVEAWAKELSECESKTSFIFWIVGSVADMNADAKDFDVVISGIEDPVKIKALFDDAYRLAVKYRVPLDMVYWSVPPVGIPKSFKVRKYRNGHTDNGARWAPSDLEGCNIENLEQGISRMATTKGFEFRSDCNVMNASSTLQRWICG